MSKHLKISGRPIPRGFIRGRLYQDGILVALVMKEGSQLKTHYLR